MTSRDERLAGCAPVWAWDALQEDPPYPPDYTPRRIDLSPEEAPESYRSFAEQHRRDAPDAPPLDADSFVVFTYDPNTPSRELLDALHSVDLRRLLARLPEWRRTADDLAPTRRLHYWRTKLDAYRHLVACDYLHRADLLDRAEFEEKLEERIRLATDAAAWTGDEALIGEDAGPPLAEKSRANDKWGPLVPALRHALERRPGAHSVVVLAEWAAISRAHPHLKAYCDAEGIDVAESVDIDPSTLSRLRKRARDLR